MDVAVHTLMLEMLDWIAAAPRTYTDVMKAWRSSCPRHPVWEEALIGGLVKVHQGPAEAAMVSLTSRGRAALEGRT